ncbi:MAG: hypothetical protein DRP22_01225 [Verrucomicrobia bacterium]|nr:MAG: hypothetical protein DRP22_01225 [Verrucomicrobiota bacterium]
MAGQDHPSDPEDRSPGEEPEEKISRREFLRKLAYVPPLLVPLVFPIYSQAQICPPVGVCITRCGSPCADQCPTRCVNQCAPICISLCKDRCPGQCPSRCIFICPVECPVRCPGILSPNERKKT